MGRYRQMMALSLVAVAMLACPGAMAPSEAASPWRLGAQRPTVAPVKKGEGKDLREVVKENAPTAMRGAVVVVVVTLAIMTIILVPFGWARRFVARQAAKSGASGLPSPREHYVKIGALGVPSEFEWDLPHLVVGGNRFDMTLSSKAKGAQRAWDLQNGTRIEFVTKQEVEEARARHEAEEAERREAAQAWRKFESTFGDAPPSSGPPPEQRPKPPKR